MLRVHDRGFLRTQPEELGVEHLHVRHIGRARNIVLLPYAIRLLSGFQKLFLGYVADGLNAAAEIVPEFLDIARTWNTQGHTDNGNVASEYSPLFNITLNPKVFLNPQS
ncbi:MAG TPA: hypothetical protein VKA94_08395 [Hyphomicrobiales bacterium]|nr:hypothetical protein [Hyphomicrobiales bacterium]